MHLAYLISAHTDAAQLKRLISSLHPEAEFFVHIDLKSRLEDFTSIISQRNVHFIEERVDVQWGTMLEVEYQMNLIRAAVNYPTEFDHIFFLSGMDYPLWSNERNTAWLGEQDNCEQLQGLCMDTPYISGRQYENYSVARPFFRNRKLSIIARRVLRFLGYRKKLHFTIDGHTYHLFKGSAWWCISQQLAEYVLKVYETKPEIRRYFRNSFCPAETLIQTIAFNSEVWAPRCLLSEGKYQSLQALTPLHFIDYDPVIKVMDETDYDRLVASGKMFCRKVVSGKSDTLVTQIEKYLRT